MERNDHGLITISAAWKEASFLLEQAVHNTKIGGDPERAKAQVRVAEGLARYAELRSRES